jgi:hypothetical protein
MLRAISMRSPTTADPVGAPPAPRPRNISSPASSPSTNTALNTSRTAASGWVDGSIAGWTRADINPSSISATARSFTT